MSEEWDQILEILEHPRCVPTFIDVATVKTDKGTAVLRV